MDSAPPSVITVNCGLWVRIFETNPSMVAAEFAIKFKLSQSQHILQKWKKMEEA